MYGFALPSRIGTSTLSISIRALSTPMPVRAERMCSIVETDAFPFDIVVLLAVLLTFSASASTRASSPISVLLNTIPVSAGAGETVIRATLPV